MNHPDYAIRKSDKKQITVEDLICFLNGIEDKKMPVKIYIEQAGSVDLYSGNLIFYDNDEKDEGFVDECVFGTELY